ncbi:hypothetical protein NDU88_004507 [Pleurodeles waltl]|uniref:Uncharacterized protein n=1 Tax=Pleurodeles waltl TaxID=8319 RepID=A0AAV7WYH4_PLEWA|nr:hypothetical protein NDU88_004507 [Pleurodeles waltl]
MIIAKIFNNRDQDAILQAAHTQGDTQYENAKVRFFPDFTLQVQRQQYNFNEVKKALRAKELKYMMLYPAMLQVAVEGKEWHFVTPEEALDWMEGWQVTVWKGAQSHQDMHLLGVPKQRDSTTLDTQRPVASLVNS